MKPKLNEILKQWPKGTVATAPWLRKHGVYRQLARRYVESGWIQPLDHGAFVRAGDIADWLGGLHALQTQLGLSIHIGGVTALSMEGQGQYLTMGDNPPVTLFSERRERLPAWFMRHAWGVRIEYHSPKLFRAIEPVGFTEVQHGELRVRASAPERAILEVMHQATTNDALDHAIALMSGLSTLRPQVVQPLLETCLSIKVKRLFLWAAQSAGHAWFPRLATDRLDLGKGKRSLYRGGRFDATYRITVPKTEEQARV